MKITVCAKCGSQDLERLAWVDHRTNKYVDDYEVEPVKKFYCNGECGGTCDNGVLELRCTTPEQQAYMIVPPTVEGYRPTLVYFPTLVGGGVDIQEGIGIDVDFDRAFDHEDLINFHDEMLMLFDDRRADIALIFAPYIDKVKEFVRRAVNDQINYICIAAHEHFKTKDGGIEPLQQARLAQLQSDLVDLITAQVKQNL